MKEIINIDELLTSMFLTLYDIERKIITKIIQISLTNNSNVVIIPLYFFSILSGSPFFRFKKDIINKYNNIEYLGTINNIKVYLDRTLTNKHIYFEYSTKRNRYEKLSKILTNSINSNFIHQLEIIDSNDILI